MCKLVEDPRIGRVLGEGLGDLPVLIVAEHTGIEPAFSDRQSEAFPDGKCSKGNSVWDRETESNRHLLLHKQAYMHQPYAPGRNSRPRFTLKLRGVHHVAERIATSSRQVSVRK